MLSSSIGMCIFLNSWCAVRWESNCLIRLSWKPLCVSRGVAELAIRSKSVGCSKIYKGCMRIKTDYCILCAMPGLLSSLILAFLRITWVLVFVVWPLCSLVTGNGTQFEYYTYCIANIVNWQTSVIWEHQELKIKGEIKLSEKGGQDLKDLREWWVEKVMALWQLYLLLMDQYWLSPWNHNEYFMSSK